MSELIDRMAKRAAELADRDEGLVNLRYDLVADEWRAIMRAVLAEVVGHMKPRIEALAEWADNYDGDIARAIREEFALLGPPAPNQNAHGT